MTQPIYTERDSVLKAASIEKILEACSHLGLGLYDSGRKREIVQGLDKARFENRPVPCENTVLTAGWDGEREEYYIVVKDVYDPSNLMTVLYERLVALEFPDVEEDKRNAGDLLSRYLGVIEEREKISLAQTREKLGPLVDEMKTTLHLFREDEFSDEDLKRLSAVFDASYFEPISELLEGVLVAIAGN